MLVDAEETYLLYNSPEEAPNAGAPWAGGEGAVSILQVSI